VYSSAESRILFPKSFISAPLKNLKINVDLGVAPKIIVTKKFINTSQKEAEKMKDVKGTIIRIIAEYLDKEESELNGSSSFTEIGLDSLDIMELVMQMQEELDCKIELSQDITTIDSLAELIENGNREQATA
jgi:acyl carrier protein